MIRDQKVGHTPKRVLKKGIAADIEKSLTNNDDDDDDDVDDDDDYTAYRYKYFAVIFDGTGTLVYVY